MSLRLGVDVGGTKCAFAWYHEGTRNLSNYEALPTKDLFPGDINFAKCLITEIVKRTSREVSHVGIALKGIVHQGTVTYSSLMGGMVQYPLYTELKRALPSGVQSLEVENDRYPLLVAERILGCGKGVDHFAVVNLGTGLSVAFFDRTTVRGESSLAGEMGLATRYIPGLRRECSIESVVSGAGIAALFQSEFGEARSAAEIFSSTDSDERAAKLGETFVSTLANLLVDISYFANPAVIVLHGSLTLSAPRFLSRLQELYASRVDPLSKARIDISRVQHANCFGAAFLCDAALL